MTNDEVGFRKLLRHLAPGDFVILEATGGLEMPAASALARTAIPNNVAAGLLHRNSTLSSALPKERQDVDYRKIDRGECTRTNSL